MITTADRYQPLIEAAHDLPKLDALLRVTASNLRNEAPQLLQSEQEAYDSAARNLWHYAATLGTYEYDQMKSAIWCLAPHLI